MDVAVCLPMKVSMSGTSQSRAGETPQRGKRPEGSARAGSEDSRRVLSAWTVTHVNQNPTGREIL